MNYVNYVKHIVFSPEIYHRRFDFDLKGLLKEEAEQVIGVALPFIAMYRPAGFALSVGMGTYRAISHFAQGVKEEDNWKACSVDMLKSLCAVIAVAGTFFHFTIGLMITTTADGLESAYNTCYAVAQGEWSKAGEELLHTAANSLYLSFILTGGLELLLAFSLVQTLISAFEAKKEFSQGKGHYLKAASKIALAALRLKQAKNVWHQIQRRDFLFGLQKYKQLVQRALNGRQVRELIEHPLNDLQSSEEAKRVILVDASGKEHDFGAHFHGFGGQLVKGDNLTIRSVFIDGKEQLELEFKVNHAFREAIDQSIRDARSWNTKEAREILSLTGSHVEGVVVEGTQTTNPWFSQDISAHTDVHLKGLGTVSVGAESDIPNLYDKITVRMDKDKTIYDLHEMISFLNLQSVLSPSTAEDMERIKLGQLFRTFFPQEATPFERSEEFFQLPLDKLKEKMIEKAPEMKNVFETYWERIKTFDILPGRTRYQIDGLADAAYEKGARALMSAITGARTDKELFDRTASILKMGLISTEVRDGAKMSEEGLSKYWDYLSGGADSVYTQLLTTKHVGKEFEDVTYYGSKVRLLISLKALETGSYQYHQGCAGSRLTQTDHWWHDDELPYLNREDILTFVENETNSKRFNLGHEVMLKERLDPSLIQGLIVPDEETKRGLIDALRKYELIQKDASGQETILNQSIDLFIRIGQEITDELIA